MTLAESGLTAKEVMTWVGLLLGAGGGILALRAKNSGDGAQRARDAAEAGIYGTALADMTSDRNGWRDAQRETEKLRGAADAQVARLMALQETHEHEIRTLREQHDREIAHLQSEMDGLRRMVRNFAPDAFRKALGPEFQGSRSGELDDAKGTP